jgi:hypothetical protein
MPEDGSRQSHIRRGGGRLNYCWYSPARSFLALGFVEIYEQNFCPFLDMYVFRSAASSSTKGEGAD